jgi:CheY-like chemotaxis protein
MIVDDNETNRRILETMLDHWGLKTISADSGAKALATLDRSINAGQAIALLISDLHMPGMDGFECCRSPADAWQSPTLLLTSSLTRRPKRCDELGVAAGLLNPPSSRFAR